MARAPGTAIRPLQELALFAGNLFPVTILLNKIKQLTA